MKNFYLIFFLPFLFAKCSVRDAQASERLKGTRLFLTIPANFKVIHRATSFQEFQKDSSTGFSITENVNDNFYRLTTGFLSDLSEVKNGDTVIKKAVKVGDFDGVYYTGPFKTAEQKSIFLFFGDSSFAVTIIGFFRRTDKIAEVELNTILKTVSYNKSLILDPLELAHFKVDLSISGFKYVPLIGMNSLTFSKDGMLGSITDERHKSSFELETYKSSSINDAEKIYRDKMDGLTEFSLSKVSNVHHRNININGNPAYEVIMDENGEDVANTKFYIVIIQKEDKALLFWGVDRDNGTWLDKFKATVQSITL